MKQLLKVPEVRSVAQDKAILKKGKKKSPTSVKGGGGIASRIEVIVATIAKYLGKYSEQYKCLQTIDELNEYVDLCIKDGIYSLDTETTGLDPLQDEIVGFSLCCPSMLEHPAYIPINHISFVTGTRVDNQLSVEDVNRAVERLKASGAKCIMFNAPFDCRVVKNKIGTLLKCFWDCSIASRCMNENEPKGFKGLKKLHQKYVLKGKEDAFKFDDLFDGINFALVPIKTGFLYAAHDAKITLEYYLYQKDYLYYDKNEPFEARNGMNGVGWLFENIEMPIVEVVIELEDTGVELDLEYCAELKETYSKKLEEAKKKVYSIIDMYADEINSYSGSVRLDSPLNIDSTQQLAVLIYDIMGEEPVDKDKPRGTGEKILKKINSPLCQAILEYRGIGKLMNTYIDKMPKCVNPKDGRVHCKFNQYGADTGRFSSNDPNLQNIPSHNKDIRKMFKATHDEFEVTTDTDTFTIDRWDEVFTGKDWVCASHLKVGDTLDGNIVKSVELVGDKYLIVVEGGDDL